MNPHDRSFERAEAYLQEMHSAETLGDLAHAWELFLIYNRRTWQKARDWSKPDAHANAAVSPLWIASQNDSVLKYCWEARNTDDHGLTPISEERPAALVVSGTMDTSGPFTFLDGVLTIPTGSSISIPTGSSVTITRATVAALPVEGRDGKQWQPPQLGSEYPPTVIEVADAAFTKLKELKALTDSISP
jgi:hypothetical protein